MRNSISPKGLNHLASEFHTAKCYKYLDVKMKSLYNKLLKSHESVEAMLASTSENRLKGAQKRANTTNGKLCMEISTINCLNLPVYGHLAPILGCANQTGSYNQITFTSPPSLPLLYILLSCSLFDSVAVMG